MIRTIAAALVTLLLSCNLWAINKCVGPSGQISFQDAPCQGKGEKLSTRPNISIPAVKSVLSPAYATPDVPAPVPSPADKAASPVSALSQEAETCLAWYKPKLRDPVGAYFTSPSKDGRVLQMNLHATNGYGGYVIKTATCEIHNGRLDNDWTKIHAQRNGWSQD